MAELPDLTEAEQVMELTAMTFFVFLVGGSWVLGFGESFLNILCLRSVFF